MKTTDGTATAGDDYTATSNTLTFQPGDTAKSVEVTIIDNDDADDDRVFYLDLSNASWGTITDSRSQCTIENEDIAGTIPTDSVISWTNFNGNNSYVGTRDVFRHWRPT
jgi:endoglucanase